MKAFSYLCVAVATFAIVYAGITATAIAKTDFTGKWVVSGTMSGDDVNETISPTCTFKQDGDELSGSCKSKSALGSLEGAVDGDTIVWHWKRVATNSDQVDATITFRGALADGVIRGQFKDDTVDDEVGTFVAQRLK